MAAPPHAKQPIESSSEDISITEQNQLDPFMNDYYLNITEKKKDAIRWIKRTCCWPLAAALIVCTIIAYARLTNPDGIVLVLLAICLYLSVGCCVVNVFSIHYHFTAREEATTCVWNEQSKETQLQFFMGMYRFKIGMEIQDLIVKYADKDPNDD